MKTAYSTLRGLEVMRMFRMGQFACWYPGEGVRGEVRLVNRQFGIYGRDAVPDILSQRLTPQPFFCNRSVHHYWEFSMFGSRQKKSSPVEDERLWNGWTPLAFEAVQGQDRLVFHLSSLRVTSSFDGEGYASETRISESELDAYTKMPLLFEDRPAGTTQEHYYKIEANVTGLLYPEFIGDTSLKIRCEIMIVRSSLSQIADEKRAGWLGLDGNYVESTISGKRSSIPQISAALYDLDGKVLDSMRKAFNASQIYKGPPEVVIILRDEIRTDMEESKKGRSYAINKFFISENWRHHEFA